MSTCNKRNNMTIYSVTLENEKGDINTINYMVSTRREASVQAMHELGDNKEGYYIVDIKQMPLDNNVDYNKTYNILKDE